MAYQQEPSPPNINRPLITLIKRGDYSLMGYANHDEKHYKCYLMAKNSYKYCIKIEHSHIMIWDKKSALDYITLKEISGDDLFPSLQKNLDTLLKDIKEGKNIRKLFTAKN